MNRPDRRPLTLEDLARLVNVSDPRISPDGTRVAFVVDTTSSEDNQVYSQIWLADLTTGATRPLTLGKKHDSQPRWSPDGQNLAFVSDRGGSREIWLLPLAGGEPRPITAHAGGAREPVWSPDGSRIVFLARGPDHRGSTAPRESADDRVRTVRVSRHRHKLDGVGYFGAQCYHLWLVDRETGATTQLTDGPADDADPCWSPDGTRLAFVSDRSPSRDDHYGGGAIHVLNLANGAVNRVTAEDGRAAHPNWSPDGEWLAYVGSDLPDDASPSHTRLWQVRPDGSGARCLTADLDRGVGQRPGGYLSPSAPAWSGDALIYQLGEGPSTALARFTAGGHETLTSGRQVVLSFSLSASGQRAALLVTDPVTPPEVWFWDADAGARPITALNAALLDEVALARPEDLRITRPDGVEVEGWLLGPTTRAEGRSPLVMVV
ncbi:MAG TPA: DPP IV N-terminal domain-containing protein, partial [Chloroflexota bacterium]|nr:DPP IV N-terminal domain-containing protein [Chloroflexota bacterium]